MLYYSYHEKPYRIALVVIQAYIFGASTFAVRSTRLGFLVGLLETFRLRAKRLASSNE